VQWRTSASAGWLSFHKDPSAMQKEVSTLLRKHAKPFAVLLATALAILALSFNEMKLEFTGSQFSLRIEARR
jgi:hypothetical protein